MTRIVLTAVVVHTVIQAVLGIVLGQPIQAACAVVAFPLLIGACVALATVAVMTADWIGGV